MKDYGSLQLIEVRKFGYGQGFISQTKDGLLVYSANTILEDPQDGLRKRKIGISCCSGCDVGCMYCFTNNMSSFRPLTADEIGDQVNLVLENSSFEGKFDQIKFSFKQMGDPLLNHENVGIALWGLIQKYDWTIRDTESHNFQYVISTSGPEVTGGTIFLHNLTHSHALLSRDARLQFSLHTTSDVERQALCPNTKMLRLRRLGHIAKAWHNVRGGKENRVTLNFVMMKGFSYSVWDLFEAFNPEDVFVKINYLDHNSCTRKLMFEDMEQKYVDKFVKDLEVFGFDYAYRNKS